MRVHRTPATRLRPLPATPRSPRTYALVLWLSTLALAVLGPSRALLGPSLVAYSLAFAALGGLWWRGGDFLAHPGRLLGLALILRVTILPFTPDLSDDMYRYVWDGWLAASGINPFRYVPSDPALVRFQQSDLFLALNSPDFHSIYPPLSQLVFAVGGAVYRTSGYAAAAFAIKALFAVMEMVGLILLTIAAHRMGIGARAVALYALNPLVLVTLTAGGHTESGLVLGLGLLAWALAGARGSTAWIGLALATASKGFPLIFAPLLARHRRRSVGWATVAREGLPGALVGLGMLAPFYFDGLVAAVASSAELYVRLFEFNAGLYRLVETVLLALTGTDWGHLVGPALRLCFLAVAFWIGWRWSVRTPRSVLAGCLAVTGAYLLTATTVHPWYLVWGLALTPFARRFRSVWLWGSWAAFPTYLAYVGVPEWIPSLVFWAGVAVFVALEIEGEARDGLLRLAGRRKARQIAPHLPGRRVLDLGAGEGYVSAALVRRGYTPVLVDVGPFARVPLPSVVYDGHRLPFPDRAFDAVFISLALHHALDPDRVLNEAVRVSADTVVVTESTYRWMWERRLLSWADRLANRLRAHSSAANPGPLSFRTVDEWEVAFRSRGLEIAHSERLNRIGHRHHIFVTRRPPSAHAIPG